MRVARVTRTETFHVTSLPAVRLYQRHLPARAYPPPRLPAFALSAARFCRAPRPSGARARAAHLGRARARGDRRVFLGEYLRERAARGVAPRPASRAAMLCSTTKTKMDGRSLPRCASTRATGGGGDVLRVRLMTTATANRDASSSSSSPLHRGVPSSRSPDEALVRCFAAMRCARARRFARAGHRCGVCFADDASRTDMRRCDGRTPTFAVPFSEERSLDVKNETRFFG